MTRSTESTGVWVDRLWMTVSKVGAPTILTPGPNPSTPSSTAYTPWTTAPVKGFMADPRFSQPYYCHCFTHTSRVGCSSHTRHTTEPADVHEVMR
jgi:hypothetical protein